MEIVIGAIAAAITALGGFLLGRRSAQPAPVGLSVPDPTPPAEPEPAPAPSPPTTIENRDVERALADLRLGVVVVAPDGAEVYRNHRARDYATGRHGDALVEAALERVISGALVGLSLEESVEIYGPPARSLLVQASPTYEEGDLSGAVGVIEDVTEARHNLRVRSDFVANVSHELRTPVGAMSVLAETIAEADDPEVVSRLSRRMQREATRLADTIEDLLALSRLESGPVDDPETVDLVSVATMAIERTAEAAAQRNVEVAIDDGTEGPVLVDGDQGQLVSAVANLVDNAVKYSDPGGAVGVRVCVVSGPSASVGLDLLESYSTRAGEHRPAPDRQGRWLTEEAVAELSVFDDGMGIPDRDLERIFERFYRVDTGRSRETGGTGLGLSIVRHAVLNHRGTADVESLEGHGSTFTIRLPVSIAQRKISTDDETDSNNNADEEATR
ncbi:MAG: ATP-binding protein [Actinomycetota bacterium]